MDSMRFQDEGRTFNCKAATATATPGEKWWWIEISGEAQRYAAFRAEPGDTAATLQPRVLAYYAQILADRARPKLIRPGWGQRRAAPAAAPIVNPAAN